MLTLKKMEDDLKKIKKEGDLKKWKMTLTKMEDDLNKNKKWKMTLKKWKTTSIKIWKTN